MKIKLLFLCVFLVVSSHTTIAVEDPPTTSLNLIMVKVGKITLDIYPLIVAQREFSKAEIERLDEALLQLSELFYDSAPLIDQKSDGYQISYEFISQYLTIVQTVLQNSHIDYARSHLYALGEMCASCHTQDTTLRTLFSGTKRDAFSDDYAFAELNFITREYDEAVKYYEKFLNSPGRKTELNIIQPLQRIITVYTQLQSDPRLAIQVLEKYISYKQHTPETLTELKNWIIGLETLEAGGAGKTTTITFSGLKSDVEKYLGHSENLSLQIHSTAQQEVQRLWLRGQLFHYLNQQPKENEIPMLLYWLAVVDRSIAYNFYFSLADLYLKQCVLKYPAHPYAGRCFDEFTIYVDHMYVQQGEKIPPGIQQELIDMQNALTETKTFR